MKLKIGFLGVGSMGRSHVQAIREFCADRAEAAAVWVSHDAHVERIRSELPDVALFREAGALLESTLDAVFISTPNFTHVPLALAALEAGKHVFAEKPVGITRAECRQMLDAARRTDRVVMIGHELRYSPFFQKIKALVDQGEIGALRMVWCRELRGPFQPKVEDWIQDARRSGGALVDKNCHHFDLMNWWVGARPRRVCAFGGKAVVEVIGGEHEVNDHAAVIFEYRSGARGALDLCLFAPDLEGEDLEMGVIGERGLLKTRLSRLEIEVRKRGGAASVHAVEVRRGFGFGGHLGSVEIHQAFLDAILEGRRPLTTVEDCVDGTLLAIAAEESIRRGAIVDLDES
jgi:predicted dehydrogenase